VPNELCITVPSLTVSLSLSLSPSTSPTISLTGFLTMFIYPFYLFFYFLLCSHILRSPAPCYKIGGLQRLSDGSFLFGAQLQKYLSKRRYKKNTITPQCCLKLLS